MATSGDEYSVDQDITHFFEKTTATRAVCDAYVTEHLGGDIIPVAVQGVCSYTVYAGPHGEYVAQFRLKSHELRIETINLAQTIYGHFVPGVAFKGQIGDDVVDEREPVYIYIMSRVKGMSYLDFLLANNSDIPENSPQFSLWRKNLITDIARFFALSWKAPQTIDQSYRHRLYDQCQKEFQLLLTSLPARFHPFIRHSLNSLPAIFSLPMVLLYRDFGVCNIMVDKTSCNLVGVVDWAEAEIAPFGLNLHAHQRVIGTVHLKNGWIRYDDYGVLEEIFWRTFSEEAGGLGNTTIQVVKSATVGSQVAFQICLLQFLFEMMKVVRTTCAIWMGC
ncbi:hypothetical protein FE257_007921 [Aspergillus nanangensis]|uniref:Aminoglycoside phosphotransferase domain-containing protein n=1 Tax=Aspergillus nanangensis TaxID=2582783 RepID=A0AAD4H077_ASPNN|nr:hypothetical protein FE257_007921 [Aspergillus nanangensis]